MVRKTFHYALLALILLSCALNLRPAASDAATPALPQAQNVVVGVNLVNAPYNLTADEQESILVAMHHAGVRVPRGRRLRQLGSHYV